MSSRSAASPFVHNFGAAEGVAHLYPVTSPRAKAEEITPEDLASYGLVRYGVPDYDFVVDLTQRIGEMFSFRDLEIAEIDFFGVRVPVVTPRTLVRMKRDTGRPQDQLDVARLRERFDLEDV